MTDISSEIKQSLAPWELEVLDVFVGIFETFGLPKSIAQIYGVLYCADEPLPQEDVVSRLGISTGSASQGLRLLHGLGAVHRQSVVGQRQSVYYPERSIRRLVAYFVDAQLRPKLNSGRERLQNIAEKLPDQPEARQKVETLLGWQRKADRALPLITGLLGK